MNDTWYYSTDGMCQGPVDTQTLRRMAWAGQLQPQHMVWKAGMADWAHAGRMPELFIQPLAAMPPPPPGAGGEALVAAPTGRTTYGDEYSKGLVWRDGKILVMVKGARLPLRCVRTNEPVEELVSRRLSWHSPVWWLLLLVGVLVCIIVILCVTKRAAVMIGLSKRTIRTRRIAIAVGWLGFLAGLVLAFAGAVVESGWLALSGLLVFLVTVIYAGVRSRTVLPTKIDDYYVYLRGCCPEYLNAFPSLRAPADGLAR